jgi:Spy/CpxP family protein refolding chaperone
MQNWKTLAIAMAALLVLSAVAVLADGTDKAEDWWTEMKKNHQGMHGDDFDTHHQGMHGENWQEHIESCHASTESGNTGMGGHMGSSVSSMMSSTMM